MHRFLEIVQRSAEVFDSQWIGRRAHRFLAAKNINVGLRENLSQAELQELHCLIFALFALDVRCDGLEVRRDEREYGNRGSVVSAEPVRVGELLQVTARINRTRGSRTLTEERPVKPGALPNTITDEELLTCLLDALTPWLER